MPETARAERPTIMPIMAMTTSSSTREKAEDLTTECTEGTEGVEKGSRGGAEGGGNNKVGADRRDGFPSWLCGFV